MIPMSRTPGILENWWAACCRKWWGSTWFWYLLSQNDYPANFIHSASVTLTLSASPLSPPSQVLNLSGPEADHKRESRSPSFWGLAKTSGMSQNTWPQSSLHFYMDSPFNVNQVKDTVPAGKQPNVIYHIPCSFTLETGGENEGILGYLRERDDGEVGCCRACVGELLCHQLKGDVSAGQGQETRRLLLKEALNIQVTPAEEHFNQVPRLLMWRQVGRVFSHFLCFRTDYNWSFQLKCWQKGYFWPWVFFRELFSVYTGANSEANNSK